MCAMCAALKREPQFENHPPSIFDIVANLYASESYVARKSQAKRPAHRKTGLGVRHGDSIYKEEE
eukprot:5684738-Pyramimonas_sp.AAC.1